MAALADAGRTRGLGQRRRLAPPGILAGRSAPAGGRPGPSPRTGLVLRDGEVALVGRRPHRHRHRPWPCAPPRPPPSSTSPWPASTLDRLAAEAVAPDGIWPPETLRALLRLLGAGRPAVAAIEALDQLGIWVRYLPEWAPIRNKPQRNAYHRYTVDRHLLETAAGAATLTRTVARPDLLLLGALLHDIGKGRGGDHTEIGIDVVRELAPRLGLPAADVATLETLVRYHLLLPEVATRRDLDDPATAAGVAAAVGDRDTLELLAALTEADSLATGPSAWGSWKAGLVARLVELTAAILEGRPPPDARAATIGPEQRGPAGAGRLQLLADGGRVTVAAPDRPGLLATVAGVLTLLRRDHPLGRRPCRTRRPAWRCCASRWRRPSTRCPTGTGCGPTWPRPSTAGIALPALLEERERHYARYRRASAAAAPQVRVTIDNTASAASTVVEVRAPDRGPVLYRWPKAVADARPDHHRAPWSTPSGAEVIDVFYVQTLAGGQVVDADAQQRS